MTVQNVPILLYTPPKKEEEDLYSPLSWIGPKRAKGNTPYFVGDISDLSKLTDSGHELHPFRLGWEIIIRNTLNGNDIRFKCYLIDKDRSGEDITGWRFMAVSGHKMPCNLLIINS